MFKYLIFLIPAIALAQTNHTSEHKALAKAVNNKLGAECITAKGTGFNVVTGGHVDRFPVDFIVNKECLRTVLDVTISGSNATITWRAPIYRQDGSLINAGDIVIYTILHVYNDAIIEYTIPATQLTYRLELSQGEHNFAIMGADKYGMKSYYTYPITETVI